MARPVTTPGTLFLDSEGVSKAASGDETVRSFLKAALDRRARVAASALTLTETLRGGASDAGVHRVLKSLTILPVDDDDAKAAGHLLGTAATRNDATVDANIAVAAMRQPHPVVLLTSDPKDMVALTEGDAGVIVRHV